eukprot:8213193-Pyramimonas_sp.AAC.2
MAKAPSPPSSTAHRVKPSDTAVTAARAASTPSPLTNTIMVAGVGGFTPADPKRSTHDARLLRGRSSAASSASAERCGAAVHTGDPQDPQIEAGFIAFVSTVSTVSKRYSEYSNVGQYGGKYGKYDAHTEKI